MTMMPRPFSPGHGRSAVAAILTSAALFAVAAVGGRRGINALYGHVPQPASTGGLLFDVLEMYALGLVIMAGMVAMIWRDALTPRRAFVIGAGFAALAVAAGFVG